MRLVIRDLKKIVEQIAVLDEASYSFAHGKVYGLIGRRDEGKEAFINAISSEDVYDSGSIKIEADWKEHRIRYSDVGVVSEKPVLPEYITGMEFIVSFVGVHKLVIEEQEVGIAALRNKVNEAVHLLKLQLVGVGHHHVLGLDDVHGRILELVVGDDLGNDLLGDGSADHEGCAVSALLQLACHVGLNALGDGVGGPAGEAAAAGQVGDLVVDITGDELLLHKDQRTAVRLHGDSAVFRESAEGNLTAIQAWELIQQFQNCIFQNVSAFPVQTQRLRFFH